MIRHRATIDRCSIERATAYARTTIDAICLRADKFVFDPDCKIREFASECLACFVPYGAGRQGVGRVQQCGLCDATTEGGSDSDKLCLSCARANDLCKHCGGDINLKTTRRQRPYELRTP